MCSLDGSEVLPRPCGRRGPYGGRRMLCIVCEGRHRFVIVVVTIPCILRIVVRYPDSVIELGSRIGTGVGDSVCPEATAKIRGERGAH